MNESLFYKWVENISSNDEHKLRFLEDTIINATRNVIYDFDIANYDDRFLDFWNLTHKVSNYLKTLSPLPINFLRKLSYTNEVIALQKKSSLVKFIAWYVQ